MQNKKHILVGAVMLAVSLGASSAHAVDPADIDSDIAPADSDIGSARPYWKGSGPTRTFAAAELELEILNFEPKLQLGYGKPHYRWFGAEAYSHMALGGGRMYAGLRGVIPHLSVHAGIRYDTPIDQFFLEPKDSYDREDIESEDLGPSRYLVGEVKISTGAQLGPGSVYLSASGYGMFATPEDVFVFEEALKVVVDPPWIWRARAAYLFHIGWMGTLRLGGGGEVLHVVEREEFTVRAGPIARVALTHHLEAYGSVMIVAYSPDTLGLVGADLGQLGLRYRWATGDRFPEFP